MTFSGGSAINHLNGQHILVALAHRFPTALRQIRSEKTVNPLQLQYTENQEQNLRPMYSNVSDWSGGAVQLLKLFQARANFTCTIAQDPVNSYGGFDTTTPSNWSGMLGMVLDRKADVLFQGLQTTDERLRDFLFSTQSYSYEPYLLVYHAEQQETSSRSRALRSIWARLDWLQIARPFDPLTWLAFGISLILTIVLIATMEVVAQKLLYRPHSSTLTSRDRSVIITWLRMAEKTFEQALRHITNRGPEIRYRARSANLLIIVLALFCVIMSALYPVELYSSLMRPRAKKNTFSDIASMRAAGYRLAARLGSSSADMLETAVSASIARNGELGKWVLPRNEWPRDDEIQAIINDTTSHIALFVPLSYYKNRTNVLLNPMTVINLQEEAVRQRQTKIGQGFEEIQRFLGQSPENKLMFRPNDTALRAAFDELLLWAREFGFVAHIERTLLREEMQLQQAQLIHETLRSQEEHLFQNASVAQSLGSNSSAAPFIEEKHEKFNYQTGLRLTDNHQRKMMRTEKVAIKIEKLASAMGLYAVGISLSFLCFFAEILLLVR